MLSRFGYGNSKNSLVNIFILNRDDQEDDIYLDALGAAIIKIPCSCIAWNTNILYFVLLTNFLNILPL